MKNVNENVERKRMMKPHLLVDRRFPCDTTADTEKQEAFIAPPRVAQLVGDLYMRLLFSILSTAILLQQVSFGAEVLTYGYDNFRTGANTAEILLTPQNVNIVNFGKVFEYPVDGAVIAQPLIAADGHRNVLIVATILNWVYAFDADIRSGAASNNNAYGQLWKVGLGRPASWGIMSTPVIDKNSKTIYVVAHVYKDIGPVFQLHAIDLLTGHEKMSVPLTLRVR
jgi:hypothetical protein